MINKNNIFYLHIPKTAGSSMNRFLASQFADTECLVHIESKIDFENKEDIKKIDAFKLLSGHIALPKMQQKLKVLDSRVTMATFRIPIEHVISHIAWVRKLGDKGEESRLHMHSKIVQKIVLKLLTVDLSNAKEITHFISWLTEEKIYLFHDTQIKYLNDVNYLVNANNINIALQNLDKLDFVGTTERLGEFQTMLCYELGWKFYERKIEKENINNNNYGLDIQNASIRKALQPLIQWDNMIYRIARERFIDDMHIFLAKLEKKKQAKFTSVREQAIKNQFIMDVK